MARRIVVSGPPERFEEADRTAAIAKADAWERAWRAAAPSFDAASLREILRSPTGERAAHHLTRLDTSDEARARRALGTMREEAAAAATLALRDREHLRVAYRLFTEELGFAPTGALVSIIEAPGELEWDFHMDLVLRLYIVSIFGLIEHHIRLLRGDLDAKLVRKPLDDSARSRLQRLLADPTPVVRRELVQALTIYVDDLFDDPIAEDVIALVGDPEVQGAVLQWVEHRPELLTTEALESLLKDSKRPGRLWIALAGRGKITEAIAALPGADEETQRNLVDAINVFGGDRGRDFLIDVAESPETSSTLREIVLTVFSESREYELERRIRRKFAKKRRR